VIYQHLLPAPEKKFSPEPCPGCPLGGARRVGGRGTENSPLVIILEAPGTEELKYGAPVCGPSGDLLNKSVPSHFDFDDAYIINAMQCRPPKTDDTVKDKEFKARACAACRPRVLEQVFRHPRKCVLAMGAWSNSVLLADYAFKVTQRRGVPYTITSETGEQVIVVPTVHPAFLLRGSGNPKVFQDDIIIAYNLAFAADDASKRVAQIVRQNVWKNPSWQTLELLEDFVAYVQYLGELAALNPDGKLPVIADIESTGLEPWVDIIRSIGFYANDGRDTAGIVPKQALKDPAYCHYLRQFLKDPRFEFVWQNGKFDWIFLVLEELVDRHTRLVHEDTLLLSYAQSEATRDHDLDEQAKNILGAPNHKKEAYGPGKRYKNADAFYRNCTDLELFDYQAKDLKKTGLIYEYNRPHVARDKALERLYTQTLIPASHMLARIEEYGIAVDFDYLRINRKGEAEDGSDRAKGLVPVLYEKNKQTGKMEEQPEHGLEKEKELVEKELHQLAGWNLNPNSPDEVAERLYNQLGLRIKNKVPLDTRKETLAKLPAHPEVKLIRKYRSITKMLSTYIGAIEKRHVNGIIHTTFKLHGTTTGRLSSSEPNIQNIPRDARYRRMYRARPGYVLLESDYNTAELRMLACLAMDEFLTGIFLDGTRSLHDEVAVAMYGPHFSGDDRIRAKAINFGIPYGRTAFTIAEEFGIPVPEAERLIQAWFGRAPQAAAFIKRCREAPLLGKTLVTVFGRKRRPGVVSEERRDGLQNEFSNFHMQSPVSDFTLHTGIEAQNEIEKYDSHFVNLVHDSTIAEVPDDPVIVRKVAGIIKEIQEGVPTQWIETPIRFKVDQKVGVHWGLGKSLEKWEATKQ
jgi:uracil-DNA glycosylase family 4